METLEPILAEHPFFSGLERKYLQLVTGCAANVRFERGEYLFRDGEEANQFYVIREGRVALQIFIPGSGPQAIDTYSKGEVVGWSWLLPPYHWHYDARATESVRAISLDGKCLREKCQDDHDLGFELVTRFAHLIDKRLDATRLQLLDLYGTRS